MKSPLYLAATLALTGVNGHAQPTESYDDLWDVSNGVVITGHSPVLECSATEAFDARNLLGGNFAHGCPYESPGRFIFADRAPEGFVHYVEWATPEPVTVRSFNLWANHDGLPYWNRAMAGFRLLAKSPNSSTFDIVLHSFTPTIPYTWVDGVGGLVISTDVRPTVAREFRAEFVGRAPAIEDPSNAPRLHELDAFASFVGPKAGIRTSEVEISWSSVPGVEYQVEYREDVPGGNWAKLGAPIIGSGSTMGVKDTVTSDKPRKFYRVRAEE